MAASITFLIAPDGKTTIHAPTILYDLYEDYRYFEDQASKFDRTNEPLTYKRMVRASLLAFTNYFEGVVNRWVGLIDPDFDTHKSIVDKLELIRDAAKRKGSRRSLPGLKLNHRSLRALRNKITHLKLSDEDSEITEELLSGRFFHEAKNLHNWLRLASHSLELSVHDDPNQLMKPYLDALGKASAIREDPLSEEDEELVRMAEMNFLEIDAREAADVKA